MKLKTKRKLAFTIVELVIVIAVIGILTAILVPTISGMIKKSKIAADQSLIASLNTSLAATLATGQISSEEDVLRVVEETYGVETKTNFAPKSSSYGYHYWYDYQNGRIILATTNEIKNGTAKAVSNTKQASQGEYSNFKNSLRGNMLSGYYLLDNTSSPIANVLNQVNTVSTKENYENLLNLTHNDLKNDKFDRVFFDTVKNHIDNTIYISSNGTFRTNNAVNSSNLNATFENGITKFPTKIFEFDGVNVNENEISAENKFVGPETLHIPETIETVDTYAIIYDTTKISNPQIVVNATKTVVSNIFKALSTNATIICKDESKLLVEENELVNAENTEEVVSVLEYSNPVSNFEISVSEINNKVKLSNGIIYVSNDQTSFNLSAINFVSSTGKNVSTNKVVWEIPTNDYVSIDQNGLVSINKLIEVDNSHLKFTVSATAVGGDVSKSLEIQLVRINYATINLENASPNSLSIDNTGSNTTISINYTGTTSTFAFSGLSIGQSHSGMVTCDSELSITAEENGIFTVTNNALTLTAFSGTANITIKIGDYIETTFTVLVIDNSASPYSLIFENTDSYLYRLGNYNHVTLGQLFTTEKAPASPVVKIYDASLTDFNGNRTEIATSGTFFANILNEAALTQDSWASVQIQFSGSGVAIIEMHSNETLTALAVEIVDGKNCSTISEFNSDAKQNKIILNNIDFTDYQNAIYMSNINLYGNGFTFNVPNFIAPTSAFIDITNGLIDNLVLKGTIYPEVVYSGDVATGYYNSGILTRGDNCEIRNSYIEGFRQPVKTQGKNLLISNTTLYGGTYTNLEVNAGNITLENLTTVQIPMSSTISANTTIVGAGIVINSAATNSSEFNIKGYLKQYNWVKEEDKKYLQDDTIKNAFSALFTDSSMAELVHVVEGVKYGNTGIIFNGVRDMASINDIRTNKSEIPYARIEKTVLTETGTVYSVSNKNGNVSKENMTYLGYTPNNQSTLEPKFTFTNVGVTPEQGTENYYYYDGSIHIGMPLGESFTLNAIEGILISKYSKNYNAINWSCDGGTISGNTVTFSKKGNHTLTYTITDRNFYDIYGNAITKSIEYTYTIGVEISYTTIPDAVITVPSSNNVIYDRSGSSDEFKIGSYWVDLSDYSLCAEVLTGLVITDYDEDGNLVTLDFTGYTSMPDNLSISASGSCSQSGFKFGVYNSKYYIYSVTEANHRDNYSITVTYSYTGQNGKTIEASKTFTFTASTSSAQITWS